MYLHYKINLHNVPFVLDLKESDLNKEVCDLNGAYFKGKDKNGYDICEHALPLL